MSTSVGDRALAAKVEFTADALVVHLKDGRTISAPLGWFPRLRTASDRQRRAWSLVGKGVGIEWGDLDEHVSVENLLLPPGKILFARAKAR